VIKSLRFPISSVIETRYALLERGRGGRVSVPVRYGVIEHETEGVILVDTGYTHHLNYLRGPFAMLYRMMLKPRIRPELEPAAYLKSIGIDRASVRHVIVTHLHPDHVSGLVEFPYATIHLTHDSEELWRDIPSFLDPAHGLFRALLPNPAPLKIQKIEWKGVADTVDVFGRGGHDLFGDGSVLAVPLPGHMPGHMGILLRMGERRVLYAVDVSWTRKGYRENVLPPFPLRNVVQDRAQAGMSAALVSAFEMSGGEVVLCHDPEPTEWDVA